MRASIEVPPGWSARALPEHGAVVVFPATEVWSSPEELSRSFVVMRTPTEQPFGRFVRQQMRRRIPGGWPTVLPPLFIDGFRAVGLDWTDGVRDIASWFLRVERDHVHEVSYDTLFAIGVSSRHVEEGRAFAARIRWSLY